MSTVLDSPVPAETERPPLRERATSFVMAAAATLLIVLGLLTLNGTGPTRPQFKGSPISVDLSPEPERADTTRQKVATKPAPATKAPPAPPKPIPVPPPLPPVPAAKPYYIPLTREQNDAADIGSHPSAPANGTGTQQASTAGDSRPVGTAPDGEPLYNAQWYRRPTDAELSFYLPAHGQREGWGMIACRTIADHHVDDCVELGSSPGSHLAGSVRQAAWQFLVRAPRLGGRELIGTWVRIRIDYTQIIVETDKPEGAQGIGDRQDGP